MFLVWGVAGLLTLFGALVCAELGSAFPSAGGVYVFLKEAFSPAVGFLWGWAMFWSMHSGIIAAIAVIFARYLAYFVPLGDAGIRVAAVAAILVLSAINYLGVRQGSTVQTTFTIGKVAAILIMIVVFAFGGWHMVTYTAEETVDPERTIPRALLIGVAVVTVCYVLLNGVYFYVLPLETVMTSTRVAADAADAVLGTGGASFMSGLVIFSTLGALSGIILAGPRVYYAMARDRLLFRWFGETHARFRTPHRAIVVQAVWASVLVATGTYRALFTRVIYTEWIFFGLMAIGLMVLRRRSGHAPPYMVWGFPMVPAVFVTAAAIIVLNQIVSDPMESVVGLGLVAVGLPLYYIWGRKTRASGVTREDH